MAELFGGALLAAYGLAGRLLIPALPLILDRRARRGLEDKSRRGERFGIAGAPRPDQPLIWAHAASVGETKAILPLIGELTDDGWFVVLTTVTVTGAETAARSLPPGVVHQFAPVDIRPYVARFLDHWRPQLALFVESEVWPVTTDELSRWNIPHVIANAHMSERSFRRWQRLGVASRRVFGRIALALAQTETDADRLARLGVRDARAIGNLKLDAPPPEADAGALAELKAAIGDRPFLLAASTHPGEDEIVIAAHQALAPDHPGLVTAIVPRHPARGKEIAAMVASQGVTVRRRAAGEDLPEGGGIYVADTLGELGLFYRLADIAFVGGSLAPVGGHNPVEPAALGAAIIHGPHTHNFAAIYDALVAAGGSVQVADGDQLAASAWRFLDDTEARRAQTEAADRALSEFTGAEARTLEALRPLLEARRNAGR